MVIYAEKNTKRQIDEHDYFYAHNQEDMDMSTIEPKHILFNILGQINRQSRGILTSFTSHGIWCRS